MFVVYSVFPFETFDGEYLSEVFGGLFAVSGDFQVYGQRPSDCEWLIPGTWVE